MAIYAYVAGALVEVVARGVLTGAWSERRRQRVIDQLNDHFIICGYGRVGQADRHASFAPRACACVVLDVDPRAIAVAQERRRAL